MAKTFFITTAIDYTNSPPHIGHAYEKVLADVIARYHRLKGEKVFYLTGVDQHGQKVQQSAAKAGVPPAEFVKSITQKFVDLWKKLDVKYDAWAETIAPHHKKVVQGMLQRLFDDKQIYKDKQSGYYSIRQEQFLTDKERGPDGEFGPEWGQVEFREEENYYFKLSQHKDWLLRYIDSRKDAVIPDFRQTELRNAVERISGDLCISRPKSRLDWGIELPFDKDFVTYVWFDALTNYIRFAGYDPMPQLLVHGWLNISGTKMSKSLGNIIDPNTLADKYGAEAVRYYLMSDIATGKDADFSEERLIERYDSDLANKLGNLVNRTLNMTEKYRVCVIKKPVGKEGVDSIEKAGEGWKKYPDSYRRGFDNFLVNVAIDLPFLYASGCNEFVEVNKPWILAKDSASADTLDSFLYTLVESLRIIAILISPVLPKAAHGIFDQLNWKTQLSGKEERFALKDAEWGKLPDGHVVGKPVPLFPRIET